MSATYQQDFVQHQQVPSFPPALTQLQPQQARIVSETFGYMPGTVGIGALLGGVWFAVLAIDHIDQNFFYAIAAAVCGLVLMVYEVVRRFGPTTFARIGYQIAVYRKGQLNGVFSRASFTEYRLSTLNTVRYLIVPVIVVFGAGFGFLGSLSRMDFATVASGLALFFGGLVLVSLIRTRIMGLHYYVPRGNGQEEVVLMKGDAIALFDAI